MNRERWYTPATMDRAEMFVYVRTDGVLTWRRRYRPGNALDAHHGYHWLGPWRLIARTRALRLVGF